MEKDLNEGERLISNIFEHNILGVFRVEEKSRLKEIESKKSRILAHGEVEWCLKSREDWIENGIENTKLFHSYTNHKKKIKMI